MNRIIQIDTELRELELRRKELIEEREKLHAAPAATERPSNPSALSTDEKIALFLSLFRCRADVYPRLWENPK